MNESTSILDVKVSELARVIIIAIYLLPAYFQTIPLCHRLWQGTCVVISLYYIIACISRMQYLNAVAIVSAFYASILVSTYLNDGQVKQFLVIMTIGIGFFSFIITSCITDSVENIARDLIVVLELYVLANLITVIVYPEGLYRIYGYNLDWDSNPAYLLGHRNNAVEYSLPLIGLSCLQSRSKGRASGLNSYFAILVSLVTSVLTWSANALVCYAFLIVSLLLNRRRGLPGYSLISLMMLSSFMSILFMTTENNRLFQYFIVKILRKTPTMTGRARIWRLALDSIAQSPVIGHGIQDVYYNYVRLTTVGSCHNYYLDFLYWGGVVCLAIVLAYMLYINALMKGTPKPATRYASIFFGTYFVLWIATPIHKESMFMMLAFFFVFAVLSKRVRGAEVNSVQLNTEHAKGMTNVGFKQQRLNTHRIYSGCL